MRRTALARRVVQIRSVTPVGCAACRAAPTLGILWPEDPEPLASCPGCGAARTGTRWVRFVVDGRGPA